MGVTFDTNFVIDVLREEKDAVVKGKSLEGLPGPQFLTAPVLYEVSAGLLFTGSRREAAAFRAFATQLPVLPFDEASAVKAAEIQAELMRNGTPKAHTDVMIAGIAAQAGHTLITRDRGFAAIADVVGLRIDSY